MFQINGNGYAENFYSTYLSFYGKEVIGEQTCYSVVFTDAQNAKDFYVSLFQNIQSVNNCLFYLGLITGIFTPFNIFQNVFPLSVWNIVI